MHQKTMNRAERGLVQFKITVLWFTFPQGPVLLVRHSGANLQHRPVQLTPSRLWELTNGKNLKMNGAQLPEVTNVHSDLCLGRVAIFSPGYKDSGAGANLGAVLCWCSDSELPTLTNGLCETTAIDIYPISPGPSTVSTTSGLAIILLAFCFFFKTRYGWCHGPPSPASPKGPPIVPQGRGVRGKRWEGDGERGEGQTKSSRRCEETHTSLCFHLSAWWTIILSIWLTEEKTTYGFLYFIAI